MKDPRGQRVKVRHRNCFSVQHTSLILVDKEILCPLPLWLSFSLLADKPHSRIWWLIIYQGNEMPKPRETHRREWKGHSRPPHRYTHTHTLSQQWWMAIISLLVLAADRVFILMSKLRRHQGQSKKRRGGKKHEWWGEIFHGSPEKSPHLKNPHMSDELNPTINSRQGTLSKRVIAQGGVRGAN